MSTLKNLTKEEGILMNKFKFHPVGQGLFYTGNLANGTYNFVYDCGSSSKINFSNCSNYFNGHINFIAISHLHEDHINGLEELLKNNIVDELILPYIDTSIIDIDLFRFYLIINGISPQTRVFNILLGAYYYGREQIDDRIKNIRIEEEVCAPYVEFGKIWEFRFFTKKINIIKLNNFKKKYDKFLTDNQVNSVEECLKKGTDISNLAIAYKEIYKNINLTSLVMVHYPAKRGKATVLTGDVAFDKALRNKVIDCIGDKRYVLQAPHHGAKAEWKTLGGLQYDADEIVFSFGENNKYGHPSKICLIDIYVNSYCNFNGCHRYNSCGGLYKVRLVFEHKGYMYRIY